MDQFSSPAAPEPKPGVAGWFNVWIKAATSPNEQAYIEITDSPFASSKTAFLWVFIASTLSALVSGILSAIISAMGIQSQPTTIPGFEQYMPYGTGGGASFVSAICFAPIAGLISILFFAIGVAIIQWIAKTFGGIGTFEKLAYGVAAISVPISLVATILSPFSLIPFLGICTGFISFGAWIYGLVLEIIAVKAVNRFGWGPAIGSVLIPIFVLVFV
jgi:hypothetical protein